MSKTIEQLRDLATQIEEATRQGENTQLRVGGLFNDIIDFIAQIPITETTLGPLLQALNNSGLINPNDGQTLTFSIMDDNWTFSDGLTQLQLRLGEISMTVTSNYEDWLRAKEQIDHYLALINERTRSLESDNIEYHSWRDQTDDHIADMVVAQDRMSGEIVSISTDVMTAWEQIRTTTNNLEISDKALKRICEICDVSYTNPDGTYSASWLYQNKQQIVMAASNFDADGNIVQGSVIDVSLDGITSQVQNVDGRVTRISQTIDGITQTVTNLNGQVSVIDQKVDAIQLAVAADQSQIDNLNASLNGSGGILARLGVAEDTLGDHATSIQQNTNNISVVSAKFNPDGSLANTSGLVTGNGTFASLFAQYNVGNDNKIAQIGVELEKKVTPAGVEEIISHAKIEADQIEMTGQEFTAWVATYGINAQYINMRTDIFETWAKDYKVSADNIVWEFSKSMRWLSKLPGQSPKEVMTLDTNGNLSITGILTQGCKTNDGLIVNAATQNFKAQYISTSDSSYGDSIKWEGGSNIIFWGSAGKNFYLPSQTNIRSYLGLSGSANFVVELNVINLASTDEVYMKFATSGTNTSFPRWMGYNNEVNPSGNLKMGNGDLVKVLIVYNSPNYNAYILERKEDGWV